MSGADALANHYLPPVPTLDRRVPENKVPTSSDPKTRPMTAKDQAFIKEMESKAQTEISSPEFKPDAEVVRGRLSEMNRSRLERWNAEARPSVAAKIASSRALGTSQPVTMSSSTGSRIHDITDQNLGLLSAATEGTMLGVAALAVGSMRAAIRSTLFGGGNMFTEGLKEHVIDSYKSPSDWASASTEKLGHQYMKISNELKVLAMQRASSARLAMADPVLDVQASEAGSDVGYSIAKSEAEISEGFMRGSKALSTAARLSTRGVIALDVAVKAMDVVRADPGQRMRVGFEKAAEFLGEVTGGFIGGLAVAGTLPETGFSTLAVSVPVAVGAASAVGYAFTEFAKRIEREADTIINNRRN